MVWEREEAFIFLYICSSMMENEPHTSSPHVKHRQFLHHSWLVINIRSFSYLAFASQSGMHTWPMHTLKQSIYTTTPLTWTVSEKMIRIITSLNLYTPPLVILPNHALSHFQHLWHSSGLCSLLWSVRDLYSFSKTQAGIDWESKCSQSLRKVPFYKIKVSLDYILDTPFLFAALRHSVSLLPQHSYQASPQS